MPTLDARQLDAPRMHSAARAQELHITITLCFSQIDVLDPQAL